MDEHKKLIWGKKRLGFFSGIKYNIKGLSFGLRTPSLMLLGLARLLAIIALTVFSASLLLLYHQEILTLIWSRPESAWISWLWHVFSWLLSLLLVGLAAIFSYLLAQVVFSVVIMDYMSRITERLVTGHEQVPVNVSILKYFAFLIRQEIPRAVLPVVLIVMITVLGWLTPLGPILTIISGAISVAFLAWDNTDLVPARRQDTFVDRFNQFFGSLLFHLGFGLWFLIPVLNILFLSFAPVGGTLYQIDRRPPDLRS